jgi:hypothetical protein
MSDVLYIQIMHPCEFYGNTYRGFEQFTYVSEEMRVVDHRQGGGVMLYYHGTNCDGIDMLIPGEYAVITPICCNESIQDRIRDRMMDKTTDYYDKVKERLGIDMNLNHSIQFNPEVYKQLYLKTPKDEFLHKTVLFNDQGGIDQDNKD